MAKLSTPYHNCQQPYVASPNGVIPKCPYAAYRRFRDRWLCRHHLRQAKARVARV